MDCVDERQQKYEDELCEVDEAIKKVDAEEGEEFLRRFTQLEDKMCKKESVAEKRYNYKVESVERQYQAEMSIAAGEFMEEIERVKSQAEEKLKKEYRILRIEYETAKIKAQMMGEELEKSKLAKEEEEAKKRKRKLKRGKNGYQIKKVKWPYVIYQAKEEEIMEDWLRLRKILAENCMSVDSSGSEDNDVEESEPESIANTCDEENMSNCDYVMLADSSDDGCTASYIRVSDAAEKKGDNSARPSYVTRNHYPSMEEVGGNLSRLANLAINRNASTEDVSDNFTILGDVARNGNASTEEVSDNFTRPGNVARNRNASTEEVSDNFTRPGNVAINRNASTEEVSDNDTRPGNIFIHRNASTGEISDKFTRSGNVAINRNASTEEISDNDTRPGNIVINRNASMEEVSDNVTRPSNIVINCNASMEEVSDNFIGPSNVFVNHNASTEEVGDNLTRPGNAAINRNASTEEVGDNLTRPGNAARNCNTSTEEVGDNVTRPGNIVIHCNASTEEVCDKFSRLANAAINRNESIEEASENFTRLGNVIINRSASTEEVRDNFPSTANAAINRDSCTEKVCDNFARPAVAIIHDASINKVSGKSTRQSAISDDLGDDLLRSYFDRNYNPSWEVKRNNSARSPRGDRKHYREEKRNGDNFAGPSYEARKNFASENKHHDAFADSSHSYAATNKTYNAAQVIRDKSKTPYLFRAKNNSYGDSLVLVGSRLRNDDWLSLKDQRLIKAYYPAYEKRVGNGDNNWECSKLISMNSKTSDLIDVFQKRYSGDSRVKEPKIMHDINMDTPDWFCYRRYFDSSESESDSFAGASDEESQRQTLEELSSQSDITDSSDDSDGENGDLAMEGGKSLRMEFLKYLEETKVNKNVKINDITNERPTYGESEEESSEDESFDENVNVFRTKESLSEKIKKQFAEIFSDDNEGICSEYDNNSSQSSESEESSNGDSDDESCNGDSGGLTSNDDSDDENSKNESEESADGDSDGESNKNGESDDTDGEISKSGNGYMSGESLKNQSGDSSNCDTDGESNGNESEESSNAETDGEINKNKSEESSNGDTDGESMGNNSYKVSERIKKKRKESRISDVECESNTNRIEEMNDGSRMPSNDIEHRDEEPYSKYKNKHRGKDYEQCYCSEESSDDNNKNDLFDDGENYDANKQIKENLIRYLEKLSSSGSINLEEKKLRQDMKQKMDRKMNEINNENMPEGDDADVKKNDFENKEFSSYLNMSGSSKDLSVEYENDSLSEESDVSSNSDSQSRYESD